MSVSEDQIRSTRFRRERETDWKRLDAIVARSEQNGVRSLSYDDAYDLATLYRKALNSLSVAREISLDRALLEYLEALCCRAYLAVYAPQESLQGLIWRFFSVGAPQAIRRSLMPLLVAFLAFAIGSVAGYLLFMDDPTWYNTFVPGGLAGGRGPTSSRAELESVLYPDSVNAFDELTAFAGFLFSHNTRIAFFSFALGVFVCLPSFILSAYQGLVIGAFFGLHVDRGLGLDLFAWLSIHGVTEIGAIIIATAGGFHLGMAVLFPGQYTRTEALRRAGHDAAKLAILAAFMLVIAALLEGFARQLITDIQSRIVIGWSIGALWLVYFMFAGRRPSPEQTDGSRRWQ
jgi:uncharacterized membrane protein SpoIIM required for sporulation